MTVQAPDFFSAYQAIINQALASFLDEFLIPDNQLSHAIRYSTLSGGKRIRPILTLVTAQCVDARQTDALPAACAIECIHAYSLIHDDLPAMDDDALRRGQPTCHIAFDEATAILAGDALQSLAFELISQKSTLSAPTKLTMIQILAKASGARGMVFGQALDFAAVGKALDLSALEKVHSHKTGMLIEASIMLGALSGQQDIADSELELFRDYAQAIGLAFQVQDDILDITSDTQTLGKRQGADQALNKPTYPSLLGLDGAKSKLLNLHNEALHKLDQLTRFDTKALAEISHFIIGRIH